MHTHDCSRRDFIRTTALAGMGVGMAGRGRSEGGAAVAAEGSRVGIIGLDTSHSIAFAKALNTAASADEYLGYRVVAAYPKGSLDIRTSVDRIPGYTRDIQQLGVEIVESLESLLPKVDVVMLETNDGRRHLEQALVALEAGKRMFIDKPIAASLADTLSIFAAARKRGVPVFSSSSLRYITGAREIREGKVGKVLGAEAYSPAPLEKTHPDLFWYGIHGVETLYTLMGTGCRSVTRVFTEGADVVVGRWGDDRIGTFRGIRSGKSGYGGTVFGETGIAVLGDYAGYEPLLKEIVRFFQTGCPPVAEQETIEIVAFMEAAQESRLNGGASVEVETIMKRARTKASLAG